MLPEFWSPYINDLAQVDKELERKRTIFIGASCYTRIVPGFFLENYEIFCLKDSQDIDLLNRYAKIYCLERERPDVIDQIHSTTELVQHPLFHDYVKKYHGKFSVMLYMLGGALQKTLEKNRIHYLANHSMIARELLYKGSFRKVLKKLSLPHLPDRLIDKDEFLTAYDYKKLEEIFGSSFVCQRGDYDTGGQRGTFFVHSADDLKKTQENYAKEGNFKTVQISKFIKGNSLSMIGCVTESGILHSSLQTQLIDVPEVLDGHEPVGTFLGHDWGNRDYTQQAVIEAAKVIKSLGQYLYNKKYRGIFGIDFMYDPLEPETIYPIECNPRFTGSFPLVSLLQLQKRLPPFELFHILEQKKIKYEADIEKLNELYQDLPEQSNIYISSHNVARMPVQLKPGIYSFNENGSIKYERAGVFPWHLQKESEFLMIDNVYNKDYPLMDDVSRLFRLIFPRRISKNSNELLPLYQGVVKAAINLINHQ